MKKFSKVKYQKIFFSPHFDDVVLSCGAKIAALKDKEQILVVTVFTSAGEGKTSKHGRKYLQSLGFNNGEEYFFTRKREDKKAAKILNFEPYWLGFPEVFFRFKKRLFFPIFFYSNKKSLFGEIVNEDRESLSQVKRKIERMINSYPKSKVYFPLGIGNHVDHQILNQIGKEIAQSNEFNSKKVFFYEDFPYNLGINRKKIEKSLLQRGLRIKKFRLKEKFIRLKSQAIMAYSSQIKPLFGTKRNFEKRFFRFYEEPYENYWYFV